MARHFIATGTDGQAHYQLRTRVDRRAKASRCACGWQGPWRETVPTGNRRKDARMRAVLTHSDYQAHLDDVTPVTSS